jgi:hypothetical protein
LEEAGRGARDCRERSQHPHLRGAGDQQRGHRALADDPGQVRRDHHRPARDAVGHHAAHEQARQQRESRARQHEPDLGRRPAELEHGERKRDDDHPVAEPRRPGGGEE